MIGVSRVLVGAIVSASLVSVGQRLQPALAGQISGVVMTTDDPPRAVRRAIVSLSDSSQHLDFHTVSDDQGRFSLTQLPKGRYSLQATRPSFVSIVYGAPSPGRSGSPIVLAEGEIQADIRLRVARGAAISGTVRDASGDPLPGRTVHVQWAGNSGLTVPIPAGVQTDDRGEYRIYGLAAGAYVVIVDSNTKLEIEVPSDADVDTALRELQQEQRGLPTVTGAGNPPPIPSSPRKYTSASIYFPTSLSRADASVVSVEAGDDRRGIDIIVRLRAY